MKIRCPFFFGLPKITRCWPTAIIFCMYGMLNHRQVSGWLSKPAASFSNVISNIRRHPPIRLSAVFVTTPKRQTGCSISVIWKAVEPSSVFIAPGVMAYEIADRRETETREGIQSDAWDPLELCERRIRLECRRPQSTRAELLASESERNPSSATAFPGTLAPSGEPVKAPLARVRTTCGSDSQGHFQPVRRPGELLRSAFGRPIGH